MDVVGALCLRAFIVFVTLLMLPVARTRRVTLLSREYDGVSLDFALLIDQLKKIDPQLVIELRARVIDHTVGGRISYLSQIVGDAYSVARSRVVVTDGYSPVISMGRRSPGLVVVQMWHALGAFKKFGRSTVGRPEGHHPIIAKITRQHEGYDRVLVSSKLAVAAYVSAFAVSEGSVRIASLPRIDYLSDPEAKRRARSKFIKYHPESKGKTVVLYAPTFRTDRPTSMDALDVLDPDQFFTVVSGHPVIARDSSFSTQELLLAADLFVTDYSSAIFEAAYVGLPIYLYAPDLAEFIKRRGFYRNPTSFGFPVARTPVEVARRIECRAATAERSKQFAELWVERPEHGSASRNVGELIVDWCGVSEKEVRNGS
jgi:CDP-glycerol glycerophosphotransferase (TagB/SpsB family)